jgi:hypothetical protein
MKIRPVGAEFFHSDRRTDGRTDMTKLTVAFRNFANTPKMTAKSITTFSVGRMSEGLGVRFGKDIHVLSSTARRLDWDPHSLLFNGYRLMFFPE